MAAYLQEPWRRRAGGRGTGFSKVREAVLEACERMNRPVEESAKVLQYLESEWLCDPMTLGAMSEDAWKEVRLPLGLKEYLRLRFRSKADEAPGSPPQVVFQDTEPARKPEASTEKSAVEVLLLRIQEKMGRENRTMKGMARRFKRMDDDLDHYMEISEFVNAMKEVNANLTDNELQMLWRYIDRDGNGRVTFEQFLRIFKPKLSERRRRAVKGLFDYLDANRNGVIQVDDLKLRCDPHALAEGMQKVRGVRMQPDEVLVNFMENFRRLVGGSVYGEVRYADFEKYYEGLSAGIDSDVYFEELLQKAWDLPSGFFQHLQVDDMGDPQRAAGTPARVKLYPHHQHHGPTFLDGVHGSHERRPGQAKTGHRLLRTLRRSLAQCCRGNAAQLYGDLVVRTYMPQPSRRGEEAPPALVPKEVFEAALLRLLPSMPPQDLATMTAVFKDAVRSDCVDYRSFLEALQVSSPARQDCAARLFDDLVGTTGATTLELSGDGRVPLGAKTVFGERSVSLQNWLDFHNLVALAAGDTTDSVYEAQLRYLWGLRDLTQNRNLAPVPGYYQGMSRVHLG
ncbi:unnamed protein product [Cladocopium goreaui]|uniref:Calcyphosin n=1 Tax=Cladocopium goreaui TaxID=2562237 RepID=A0A9P1M6I6_9DINO|nr:unnamed protein product [Cladocopium goreaui]